MFSLAKIWCARFALIVALVAVGPSSAAAGVTWGSRASAVCRAWDVKYLRAYGGPLPSQPTAQEAARYFIAIAPLMPGEIQALRAIPGPRPAQGSRAIALTGTIANDISAIGAAYRAENSAAWANSLHKWVADVPPTSQAFKAVGASGCE